MVVVDGRLVPVVPFAFVRTQRERELRRRLATWWGAAVARRRSALGLTQAELARRCSVEQQTVSKIENGLAIPRDELKQVLSTAMGTHPWELFAWPGQPPVGTASRS